MSLVEPLVVPTPFRLLFSHLKHLCSASFASFVSIPTYFPFSLPSRLTMGDRDKDYRPGHTGAYDGRN